MHVCKTPPHLPDGEADDDAEVVSEQLVGARLGVVDVHVDGVVDEVADAEGERQEEHLARVVDQVRQDLRAEVEQVDRRRQARDGAVQQRRRDVAELPGVLKAIYLLEEHCMLKLSLLTHCFGCDLCEEEVEAGEEAPAEYHDEWELRRHR